MTNPSPIGHDEDVREWVRKGLEELERLAGLSERAYARWRRIYERVHFLLGVPATILAAAASISAFSDASANWVAGLLAGASAALVGLQTLVRPDQKARFNQQHTVRHGQDRFRGIGRAVDPVEGITHRSGPDAIDRSSGEVLHGARRGRILSGGTLSIHSSPAVWLG